jgi:purine nucleoside phosphorylase
VFGPQVDDTDPMMMRSLGAIVLSAAVLPGVVVAQQPKGFSYLGIGLTTDLAVLAREYPHSLRTGEYIYVAPQDSRDHVSGIEVSPHRVRISFESRADPPQYPACAPIEKQLAKDFGAPQSIRRFDEEATRHADRRWSSPREELTLVCFVGPRGQLVAEAVVISPR